MRAAASAARLAVTLAALHETAGAGVRFDGRYRVYEDNAIRVEFDEQQGGTVTGIWDLKTSASFDWGGDRHVITLRASQLVGAPDGSDKGFTQYWEKSPQVTVTQGPAETAIEYHGRMRYKDGLDSGMEYRTKNGFVPNSGVMTQRITLIVHAAEMAVRNPEMRLWALSESLDLDERFTYLATNTAAIYDGAGSDWTRSDVSSNEVTGWLVDHKPPLPNHGYKVLPKDARPTFHWFDIFDPALGGIGRLVLDRLGCNSYNWWSNTVDLRTRTSELAWSWGDWDRHAIEGNDPPLLIDGMALDQRQEFWVHSGDWLDFVARAGDAHGVDLLCGAPGRPCATPPVLDPCESSNQDLDGGTDAEKDGGRDIGWDSGPPDSGLHDAAGEVDAGSGGDGGLDAGPMADVRHDSGPQDAAEAPDADAQGDTAVYPDAEFNADSDSSGDSSVSGDGSGSSAADAPAGGNPDVAAGEGEHGGCGCATLAH